VTINCTRGNNAARNGRNNHDGGRRVRTASTLWRRARNSCRRRPDRLHQTGWQQRLCGRRHSGVNFTGKQLRHLRRAGSPGTGHRHHGNAANDDYGLGRRDVSMYSYLLFAPPFFLPPSPPPVSAPIPALSGQQSSGARVGTPRRGRRFVQLRQSAAGTYSSRKHFPAATPRPRHRGYVVVVTSGVKPTGNNFDT